MKNEFGFGMKLALCVAAIVYASGCGAMPSGSASNGGGSETGIGRQAGSVLGSQVGGEYGFLGSTIGSEAGGAAERSATASR